MAFSTQKGFLPVTFMNERNKAECLNVEVPTLKTYASTPDQRAWSLSKDQVSQYLVDLVECRTYDDGGGDSQTLEFGNSSKPVKSKDNQSILKCIESTTNRGPKNIISAIGGRSMLDSFVGFASDIGTDNLTQATLETIIKVENL